MAAKFIVVTIMQYLLQLLLLAPVFVGYGVASGVGGSNAVVYYAMALIVFLTLPVIPIIFSLVICMIVMRFSNLGKHKEAFKLFFWLDWYIYSHSFKCCNEKSRT